MRRLLVLALVLLGALATAASAPAAPSDPFQFKKYFDTTEISGGVENVRQIAVNREAGSVTVYERGRLHQFDAEGNAVDFPATGSPTIEGVNGGQALLIDNSGSANQGNIYVIDGQGCCNFLRERFWSYGPDGESLGTNPHEELGTSSFGIKSAWIAADGQLYLTGYDYSTVSPHVVPVEPEGPAAGPMEPWSPVAGEIPFVQDDLGHLYAPGTEGTFARYDFTDNYTYEGETGLPTASPTVLDPSTNDLYQRQNTKVVGIHYSDPLVKSTPFEVLAGIAGGDDAIALDETGETMYVGEGTRISIFHREPASAPRDLGELGVDSIRSNRADLHGQLIAGGVPTDYYFEYGTDTSYGSSSTPQDAPFSHFEVKVDGGIEGLQPDPTYRVLYSTHSGAIPGPWNPTNHGPDPYLATRGADGWNTDYLGLPADINPEAGSFSSALGEASARLDSLAFAGPGLCDPCFASGIETGIPVRRSDGSLVQGMAGSLDSSVPATAMPEGKVAKYFSDDGTHLVFASKYAFEAGANEGGDLTVYERDLAAGSTEIVSTDTSGAVLTGAGISELDVDDDGSRVLVAKRVAVNDENEYVHPYLHLSGTAASVDLAPGTTSGVLYAGMTGDGSRLFYTTVDQLLAEDTDSSADLYAAAVDGAGTLDLELVTPTNSDACNPVGNEAGAHWNTTGSGANCDAVAVAGGGGISADSGTAWFLSPEQLDGAGTLNQPNLYRADPGGAPSFVVTLEPDNPLVLDSVAAAATRRTADFQATGDGAFAAFVSDLDLAGYEGFGFLNVFFFTHDTLAPQEDHLGPLMKIYDARAGGGFFVLPAEVPCAAADECHGPSSPAPSPPDIKSSGPTTRGNVLVCKKPKVKRHGKCVKKHKKKHHK